MRHIFNTFEAKLRRGDNWRQILDEYANVLHEVYSLYVVKRGDDYIVKINVSQIDRFNTIDLVKHVDNIICAIHNHDGLSEKIYHAQPSLEILDETYTPLMVKLVDAQHKAWSKMLSLDDLYQLCRLTLCKLYNKGYYIHKTLLQRSFENDVLHEIRSHKNEPQILSLFDEKIDGVPIADCIEDTQAIEMKENEESDAVIEDIFKKLRPLIALRISDRRFDMLMFAIKTKHVTQVDHSLIKSIRKYLSKLGYTTEWFQRQLRGD